MRYKCKQIPKLISFDIRKLLLTIEYCEQINKAKYPLNWEQDINEFYELLDILQIFPYDIFQQPILQKK